MFRAALLSFLVTVVNVTQLGAQAIPQLVEDALRVRVPFQCHKDPVIDRDSTAFFPPLTIYVARCTTYYGIPESVAVAVDSAGVLYLLDSQGSFLLLEKRLGQPALDSTSIVEYAMIAAKLSGEIPWDAQLQHDSIPDPDPRALGLPITGECEGVSEPWFGFGKGHWEVFFDVASAAWLGRLHVWLPGMGGRVSFSKETFCMALHNP
jgi:hypothetical protein